ncbi:hypothetical protein BZA05DRAFT_472849 [Tricharina praecox]|uniref:uncharacterized protein n=1 Tax=Tricharina praecox TaxID=43433 RepID=UPI0022205B55|nr:uncharacterized protein BZA05DRAFT_472849 [Tricharina praecox]KAI5854216.1 hypothetical protein BZA05DRAFT_472849 [Tricharina praecox]
MADSVPAPRGRASVSPHDDRDHQHHGNGSARQPSDDNYDSEEYDRDDDVDDGEGESDDYYSILNVPRDASPNQIRTAYHSLSRRFHPDKQPPDMRDRATTHFNRILIAYETLMNPHKRIIYDQFGVEGLKERAWQLGVRPMSPEQFKFWLEENMRKQKAEQLEELVASHGKVEATVDVSGLWFSQVMLHQQKDGRYTAEELQPPVGAITRYVVKHSFNIPLEEFARILEAPLPTSVKGLWEGVERPRPAKHETAPRPKPMLTFDCALDGAPPRKGRKASPNHLPQSVFASTSFTATLMHMFPNLPPDAPRSVASLLAGNQFAISARVLPSPVVTAQVSRAFGQNALTTSATFIGIPRWEKAPIVETNFTRRLAVRHSVFVGVNTGGTTWLANFSELFSLPRFGSVRSGYASLGYTFHPISSALEEASENAESGTSKMPSSRASRSKRTETYTASVTAGLLAAGIQAKLSWGRTFFVGTPVTSAITPGKPRSPVGIRLGLETTLHVTGAAQYTVKASRRFFENTTCGVAATMGGSSGKGGVIISLSWSRLGQRFSLPVILAPIPDNKFMIYATALPFAAYVATELFWLRPRERKLRAKEVARLRKALHYKTRRRKRAAEEAAEIMAPSVKRKMDAERETGGLVIVNATYGDEATRADVTIALAALVEGGQLVLPRGVDKSRIIGFYDPAPGAEKVLDVTYLWHGVTHCVTVRGAQGLTAPLRSHQVKGN